MRTCPRPRIIAFLVRHLTLVLILLIQSASFASSITHRYSFDWDASDSVGIAHGVPLGDAVIANGALVLNGTNGVVQLPDNLFTDSESLTLEVWFANSKVAPLQHLWLFSGSPSIGYLLQDMGAGAPLPGCYYGDLTSTSRVHSVRWRMVGGVTHLVWTQDRASESARIYANGQLVGERTNFIAVAGPTTNCFLGGADVSNPIEGAILEFRIYSNAITHLRVLQSNAMGPDAMPVDQDVLTGLDLRLPSHLAVGSITRPIVYADFAHQPDVCISSLTGITYTSDDTNIVSVTANGRFHAGALGSATITANYGGLFSSAKVVVVDADQFSLAHRYDFDGEPGSTNVVDLAGGAHGAVIGQGAIYTNAGQLYLPGGYSGYVDLPDGILSRLSEVTIEAWVTGVRLEVLLWPRVFDFGDQWNHSYFFLSPTVRSDYITSYGRFMRFAVTTNWNTGRGEIPRLTGLPWMSDFFETHLAVTYSPARDRSKLYRNGVLVDSGPAPIPLNFIVDTNNWLGRSQWSSDSLFHGLFNEFRIYRTILDDSEIAASYSWGPDVIGADFVLRPILSGTDLTLSWGPSASWCRLERRSLATSHAPWTAVTNICVFSSGRFSVTVPIASEGQLFRLRATEL